MLLLNRARLINWHFFTDSVIEFSQMSLLAGDNSAGKSTIIDAIQYALVANIRKIRFNQAATDLKSGRNLESYCRCKVGADSVDFLRKDSTSHVILEFRSGDRVFCCGIMVECFSDSSDPNEFKWIFDNNGLDAVEVYKDKRFLKMSEFRQEIKNSGAILCSTKSDYNSRLTHFLGVHKRNVNFNPYLEAVVRSVNFTPFSSVDRFVCNYILEERQVEISAMKDNLYHYSEAEKEAIKIEERINQLKDIKKLCDDIEEMKKQIILQNMLLSTIDCDICREELKLVTDEHEKKKVQLAADERQRDFLAGQIADRENLSREYRVALLTNNTYALFESLEKQLADLDDRINKEKDNINRYESLKIQLETLIERSLDENIDHEIRIFEKERDELNIKIYTINNEIQEIESSIGSMKQEVEELKKGVLRYPDSSTELLRELKEKKVDAWIFSELLNVNDESWQNAVEGWLNTQRFNILVNEKDYQKSIDIYNSMPKNIHSVGLPDFAKIKNSEIKPGSLAEVVNSDSPLGKRYLAFLLGEVMMAKIDTLREHRRSVTKDCMRYSGFTASRISPEIYSRWFIGKQAKEKREQELYKHIEENKIILSNKHEEINTLTQKLEICKRGINTLSEMKVLAYSLANLSVLNEDYLRIKKEHDSIDTSEFSKIQTKISGLEVELKKIRKDRDDILDRIGGDKQKLNELSTKIEEKKEKIGFFNKKNDEYISCFMEYLDEFRIYYRERTKDKNYNEVKQNFERSKKGNETRFDNFTHDLRNRKIEFNRKHNIYLSENIEDNRPFIALLEKYSNTELPQYKEKISRAKSDAEKQFKEHFVTKLNEYIEEARESFKEINSNLKNIRFGKDSYRFTIEENPESKNTLSVIKKAAKVTENSGTLWEHLTSDEDREIVDRLFNSILENEIDSFEVKTLCDYREYFQYDIKITHGDIIDNSGKTSESSLSRVLKEKSGGETQTPYYVAIAASFFRFFKNEPNAIRLVLFDEAFSKMDDNRIGKTIQFFRDMGVQIITAVPTEKIEPIVPFMDKTNIVIRNGNRAYVRDYTILTGETDANSL